MMIDARNYESSLANVQGEIEARLLFDKLHMNILIFQPHYKQSSPNLPDLHMRITQSSTWMTQR